jgi:hypothetical protein
MTEGRDFNYPELIEYTKSEIQLIAKFRNVKSYIIQHYDSQITEKDILMVFEVLFTIGYSIVPSTLMISYQKINLKGYLKT